MEQFTTPHALIFALDTHMITPVHYDSCTVHNNNETLLPEAI